MKFKYLLIAFSIIIVLLVLVSAMLPILILGEDASNFRYFSLPVIIFMVLLLTCLWVFFLLNYRLLSLLEREDWPALAYYLEQEIFVKGRYSARKVRLLASSYIVISDYYSVAKLESKAMAAKPAAVVKNLLIFGTAKIMNGKPKEAAVFFSTHLAKAKSKEKEWVIWFRSFSHLLDSSFDLAEPEFLSLSQSSADALITGLSAYFLSNNIAKHSSQSEKCNAAAEIGRERVIKSLKQIEDWNKEADKMAADIHISIIRKYISEAGNWLFKIDGDNNESN